MFYITSDFYVNLWEVNKVVYSVPVSSSDEN